MADVIQLKTLIDAYGVAVRAGALTPQQEDEVYFRRLMDLPQMSSANKSAWSDAKGIKQPITLKTGLDEAQPAEQQQQEENEDATE